MKIGDHQAELIFRNKPIDVVKERKYSKMLATQFDSEDVSEGKFYRLKLLPEQYCYEEYYYPENKPYRVYFHNVCNRWFVYKTYQRIDDLSTMDNFNAKAYYICVMPNHIMKRANFNEICDFISTVSVLHGEEQRKLELQNTTGGGFRANMRTMKGRKVPPTFLASYAREQKNGPSMVKILLNRNIAEIQAYQRARLDKIEESIAETDLIRKIKACFLTVQRFYEQSCMLGSSSEANELIILNGVTVSDLCNELIDYPVWVGFHYYFMRTINKEGLKIVYDDLNYFVKEGQKLRHLRVLPSKYTHKPQATTIFGGSKVYSKGQIPLSHWPLNDYPPSVDSVSGYSTITRMSTATTSPNSWQNDWKMQSRHDEYDHRLTETTIPNIRDTRARGHEQFAIRFNKELSCRIDFALADVEAVLSTTMVNYKMDPRVVAACDKDSIPNMLDRHGDLTWLKKAESRISSILNNEQPTVEDKKDLQVLYYAKQRYEQTLSRYECHPFTQPQSDSKETLSSAVINSGYARTAHLCINDSWRRIIDSNRIPTHALQVLKLLVTDQDAWPLDSDFSNLSLVDRADKIFVPHVIELFNRFHVKNKGMKFLAITTFLIIVIFLVFLALVLALSQNKEDVGYCPSKAFRFDPKNPHRMFISYFLTLKMNI
ncbi:unnamed protein product [Thelazia callipaeda]|uniref:FERM domain-containing protein n=1 Tax=Thelazia callipaeda TaxID=103827 RepID=A0A0N5D0S1_THECL|nr:unnamed protein product [Thelazia callipaeda]